MEKKILKEIEKLREEMVEKGEELGLDHPLVLSLSEKLDLLHMEYIKIQNRKKYKQKDNNHDRLYELSNFFYAV